MPKTNQVYLDSRGKKYVVEDIISAKSLLKTTEVVCIRYEDGSQAIFTEKIHLQNSRLEESVKETASKKLAPWFIRFKNYCIVEYAKFKKSRENNS